MAPRTRRPTTKKIELGGEHMERENHAYDEEILHMSDDGELSDSWEDDDPSFNVDGEEACLRLSKLSMSRPRHSNLKDDDSMSDEEESCLSEVSVPPLHVKEAKCFEKVEKIINDGGLEKLKVDECKIYLRKYGLRLTGKKDILIDRIKEHREVKDGGGEKLYPESSFVLNCKGDACTGDVVLFEQNVYDMYSIISRSATAPPCGIRLVAGRIVKESYGAAKQQHTFTIEVLWSKGVKPLPPLHPLLVKGRNLYRLKTVRQRWPDEMERSKVLQEKHSRGSGARLSREVRVQKKEMRTRLATSNWSKKQEGGITSNQQGNVPPQLISRISQDPTAPIILANNNVQANVQSTLHHVSRHGQTQTQPPPTHQAAQNAPVYVISQIHASWANQLFPSQYNNHKLYGCGQQRQPLIDLNPCSQPWNQQQINKQVCRHFARGSCYYGNSCKFVHDRR